MSGVISLFDFLNRWNDSMNLHRRRCCEVSKKGIHI